jgi:hypothetical protein
MVLAACGGSAAGSFHVDGPQTFRMAPTTCDRLVSTETGVVDLYRKDPKDDTELVIGDSGVLLVRLPGKKQMVKLLQADCRVYDVDEHDNGVTVNGVCGVAGHVKLDCEAPELGHVVGSAQFSCWPRW